MKILQINSYYKEGSTGKIVDDIHLVLKEKGFDSIVCYSKGLSVHDNNIYQISVKLEKQIHRYANRIFGMLMYGGLYRQTNLLFKIIEQEKPDVVHLHCVNGNSFNVYKLLRFLADNHIKTVVTNHAEFFYTGSCGYSFDCGKWRCNPGCGNCPNRLIATGSHLFDWTRYAWTSMKKAFDRFNSNDIVIVSVSPWVSDRAIQSPIQSRFSHKVILNGVNTKIFHHYPFIGIYKSLKKDFNRKTVFHATASFDPADKNNIKGAHFLVSLAEMMHNVDFVVAAIDYKNVNNLPSNILFWGPARTQEELARLYSEADCTLLVSRKETFSMPTAESLCCGTPIVGFRAGGPESFAPLNFTTFVQYGNVRKLKQALEIRLGDIPGKKVISDYAIPRFSKEQMANAYIKLYNYLSSTK